MSSIHLAYTRHTRSINNMTTIREYGIQEKFTVIINKMSTKIQDKILIDDVSKDQCMQLHSLLGLL